MGSARSSSEIITQWQLPAEEHRNGHILGYVLRYKLHGYNETPWMIQNITNEAQKNYLITDLITWKDYIVQIAAYNDKGVGVFTNELRIKTKEGGKISLFCKNLPIFFSILSIKQMNTNFCKHSAGSSTNRSAGESNQLDGGECMVETTESTEDQRH